MQRRKLIKIAGSYALFYPYVKALGNIPFKKMMPNGDDLKAMCIAAFNRFEEVWEFNDFWKRGNTFDACLCFADAVQQKWPADPDIKLIQQKVGGMLEENLRYFKGFDPGGLWADDFGWWGLMGLHARQHLLRLDNQILADEYLHLSTDLCWLQERDHAYDFTATAKPVPHGCRNGDANGQSKGVKNTVTNVLFFLLSARIYRTLTGEQTAGREKYLEMAYHQWVWFDSWIQLAQYEYLKKTASGGALVQERPTAFFDGSDYRETSHPTWEQGWTWTGDQGMLLAAFADMLVIKDDLASWVTKNKPEEDFSVDAFTQKVQAYIKLISRGIQTTLIGNEDHIIREAPFVSNMGPEFGNDYLAGRGIMMRYLGQLDKHILHTDFHQDIHATAKAVWQTRDASDNQFQPEFTSARNDEMFIGQFKKQWGMADNILKWDIAKMNEQQKFGVCQSIGLDALGASIRLM